MSRFRYLNLFGFFSLILLFAVSGLAKPDNGGKRVTPSKPAVQNLVVFPGDGKLYLHWDPINDPSFQYYEIVDASTENVLVSNLSDTMYTISDIDGTPLANGTEYSFRINAVYSDTTAMPSDKHGGVPRSRSDDFGYTWSSNLDIDGTDNPVYSWTDISGTADSVTFTSVTGLSDKIDIGFEFPFYSWKFKKLRIGNSGYVTFVEDDNIGDGDFIEFPSGEGAEDNAMAVIAPFLAFTGGSETVYYKTDETNSTMTIQFSPNEDQYIYQLILKSDGSFIFQYKDIGSFTEYSCGWQNYQENDGILIEHPQDDYQSNITGNLAIKASFDFSQLEESNSFIFATQDLDDDGDGDILAIPDKYYYAYILKDDVSDPKYLAVDPENDKIYWVNVNGAEIYRADLDGENTEIFENSGEGPIEIDLYHGYLFWIRGNNLYKTPLDGGTAETVAEVQNVTAMGLSPEDEMIYIAGDDNDNESLAIMKLGYDGIYRDTLDVGASAISALEVDPGNDVVYFLYKDLSSQQYLAKTDLNFEDIDLTYYSTSDGVTEWGGMTLSFYGAEIYYSLVSSDGGVIAPKASGPDSPGLYSLNLANGIKSEVMSGIDELKYLEINKPGTPMHLRVDAEPGKNVLRWPVYQNNTAYMYHIYRDTVPFPDDYLLDEVPYTGGDSMSYQDEDVETGKKYYYRLVLENTDGVHSLFSIQDSAITQGRPDIHFGEDNYDFGSIPKYEQSQREVVIYNIGDGDLTISDIYLKYGDVFYEQEYYLDLPVVLAPGDSFSVSYTFDPGGSGVFSDSLIVETDDFWPNSDGIYYVEFSGEGYNSSPEIEMPYETITLDEDFGAYISDYFTSYFYDPDDDPLTFIVERVGSGDSAIFEYSENDTVFFLYSKDNASGTDSLRITAFDEEEASVSTIVPVVVNPVNDAPYFTGLPDVSFPEDSSATLSLNDYVRDVDDEVSALEFSSQVLNVVAGKVFVSDLQVSIDPSTHVATFTTTRDTSGIFNVVFTVSDASEAQGSDTIRVTVEGVNDPPEMAMHIADFDFDEDFGSQLLIGDLYEYFRDPDGDHLSFSASASDTILNVSVENGGLRITSNKDLYGTVDIYVTASDPFEESVRDTFTVTVKPVNDPPVLSGIPDVKFPEDSSATLSLNDYVRDVDDEVSALEFSSQVLNVVAGKVSVSDLQISIDPSTHVATFITTRDTSGTFETVFTAADASGASSSDTVMVIVSGRNDIPELAASLPDVTLEEDFGDSLLVSDLNVNFRDPDGDNLRFSVEISDTILSVQINGSSLGVYSLPDLNGKVSVTVTGEDPFGAAVSDTFDITVNPVNDAPLISGIPDVFFDEDDTARVYFDQYLSDVDNSVGELSVSAEAVSVLSGKVQVSDLKIAIDEENRAAVFTATADTSGIFSVVFKVEDPVGAWGTDTVKITVRPAQDAPIVTVPIADAVLEEDFDEITWGGNLNLHFSDPDGDALAFSALSADTSFYVRVEDDTLRLFSADNYYGITNVFVTAADGNGGSVTDTFRVTVQPVNDAPGTFGLLAPTDGDTLTEEDLEAIKFTWENAVDIDSDELTYTLRITGQDFDTTFIHISDTVFTFNGKTCLNRNAEYAWSLSVSDGEFEVQAADTFIFHTPAYTAIGANEAGLPSVYKLYGNYPNPFNPSTTIRYDLPEAAEVKLTVYNILGQVVKVLVDSRVPAGGHSVVWDGKDRFGQNVSTGVYLVMIKAKGFSSVKKMTLMK